MVNLNFQFFKFGTPIHNKQKGIPLDLEQRSFFSKKITHFYVRIKIGVEIGGENLKKPRVRKYLSFDLKMKN